ENAPPLAFSRGRHDNRACRDAVSGAADRPDSGRGRDRSRRSAIALEDEAWQVHAAQHEARATHQPRRRPKRAKPRSPARRPEHRPDLGRPALL
ncbi:MAG: hypothetical protein AVDCRST_MAG90-348, partial [uncultured Microvirga sp.]